MAHFCLLSDPDNYVAHDWDLIAEASSRQHWLGRYAGGFEQTLACAAERYGNEAAERIACARKRFHRIIEALDENPASLAGGALSGIIMDRLYEAVLRDNGIGDPFADVKARANAAAVALYARAGQRLSGLEGRCKWLQLVRGVLAGNMFDVGTAASAHPEQRSPDFFKTIDEVLAPRPWLIDNFDLLWAHVSAAGSPPWRTAVVFVDNAGGDFILGVVPMVKALAVGGTRVILAANELPSLNDLTAEEVRSVLGDLAGIDGALDLLLRDGMIDVVSSGCDLPMIDLADVADGLNAAAADADLLVLEGMGRAVESNFDARFKVDALRLALIKDEDVARRVGGRLYDCVCKWTPA